MLNSEESEIISFAKGVAIILVLYGHSLQYGNGTVFFSEGLYWENPVMKTIYSFHMPLFIMLSGYLSFFSISKRGYRAAIYKRLRIFIPICTTWAFILWFIDFLRGRTGTLLSLICYFLTDFWFLWAVIYATIFVCLVEVTSQKFGLYGTILCYLLFIVLALFTPNLFWSDAYKFIIPYFMVGYYGAKNKLHIPRHFPIAIFLFLCCLVEVTSQKFGLYGTILCYLLFIVLALFTPNLFWSDAYKFIIPYFMVGYYGAKNKLHIPRHFPIAIFLFLCWFILLIFYDYDAYIYTTGISLLQKDNIPYQLLVNLYRWCIGFVGCFSVLYLIVNVYKFVSKRSLPFLSILSRTIRYMGNNSIAFYLLSTYMYVYIIPPLTNDFHLNYITTAIETVLVTASCLLLWKLLSYFPALSKIVVGK